MSWAAVVDAYALRARIFPAMLVIAPAAATLSVTVPVQQDLMSAILGGLGGFVMLYALSHVVRRAGKRRERRLWRSWGGEPTMVGLRLRTAPDRSAAANTRDQVARAVYPVGFPTIEDEWSDPRGTDATYESAVAKLRERTRDPIRFPVVFAENVSYGFRRNTWAIRGVGSVVAGGSAIVGLAMLNRVPATSAAMWVAVIVDLLMLAFWTMVTTQDWVREAAESYRDALFNAATILDSGSR